jgi:RNA polymerase sigma-70 factor (ECF subfamily)
MSLEARRARVSSGRVMESPNCTSARSGYEWAGFPDDGNLLQVWVRFMYRNTGTLNIPAFSDEEDSALLARVSEGDEQAMASLFDRYSKVVYSVALRVLRDPASAEDVLQEIFMQIWRNPVSFTASRGSLGGWLAVVSRNRSIDALRRRKPSESVEEVVLASPCNLGEEAARNIMIERARVAIYKLPAEQRKTLEMAFFDGLTHSEIAEMTGDPLGTVKTRIRSALTALRKVFQS